MIRILGAIATIMLFLAGCGATNTQVTDTAPPPKDTTPKVAEPTASGPPALFAKLFDPKARWTFNWEFEVDTHDPDDPTAGTSATVVCKIVNVKQLAKAWTSELECEGEPKGDDPVAEPELGGAWVATSKGLWYVESAPGDVEELAELLKTPAWLTYPPKPLQKTWTTDEDGMEVEHEMAVTVTDAGAAVCRSVSSTEMYGSSEAYCISAETGLVSVDITGRAGPSTESYEPR